MARIQKTNAMRELERAGIAFEALTYEVDESDLSGIHVSERLGEDPEQGFKTLVTVSPAGDHAVLCIPVAHELDLKAAARAAGQKSLSMLRVHDLLPTTGYMRGGCSPVGMKRRFPTIIDRSCERWDAIFISGGRRGLQLKLSPRDLIAHTGAITAGICRKG
ncbi:MAG: Cys-tRNA(Pro) deacylase [Coriobacteriaceae bacterium]|nr:Cys-tRNA(Pro) deacylase [Coriobacteriaceae bacterium]